MTEEEASKAYRKYQIPHFNSSIEKEVVACRQSVLIREIAYIEAEMLFFTKHYYWLEFYNGKETLDSQPYGVTFMKEASSNIPRSFKSLQETGILPRVEAKFHASKYAGRKPVVKERKEIDIYLKMDRGIGTLFIVFVIANCIAVGAFLIDICILIKKRRLLQKLWYKRRY
ncbi:hypothetical protein Fcan01_15951 [Folsomia candida]|uniref:Uncharacterized protein n=1 Tax=Folsomia candida TaxID=158441 RepID=A0A226DWD2_FOLCA|nr:hypothetical protein Fcan01_15951 [Folsomia candida]